MHKIQHTCIFRIFAPTISMMNAITNLTYYNYDNKRKFRIYSNCNHPSGYWLTTHLYQCQKEEILLMKIRNSQTMYKVHL